MSYVMATPEMMAAAATDVAVIPAAADEVSAGIAQVFSRAAQEYQALAGQAAAFNQKFVQHLTAGAGSYAAAEAANAAVLQPLTASAASAASVISDLPGQILNTLTTSVLGALNDAAFLGQAVVFLAQAIPSFAFLVTYVTLLASFVGLVLVDLFLKAALGFGLGVSVPF